MDSDLLIKVMAFIGTVASVVFVVKHSAQFAKWIAAARARAKSSGLTSEVETRLRELERIVKQHDGLLATAAAQPIVPSQPNTASQLNAISQPATPAATPQAPA